MSDGTAPSRSAASSTVGKISGNKAIVAAIERAQAGIKEAPENTKHQPAALETTRIAAGIDALRSFKPALAGLKKSEALVKLKALIQEKMGALQSQKEGVLNQVLGQVRPLEVTWRGLEVAYKNSIGEGSKSAKFYLVNVSKESLRKEFEVAPTVKSKDERKQQSLIEYLLRDKADLFGGNPYCLVVLPFAIEEDDVDFYRELGKIGRRYRCPIVGTFGASLAMQEPGQLPVSGDEILGALRDQRNQAWKRLVDAPTPEDAEALSYLCLMLPSIAVRRPFAFQRDLEPFRQSDDALFRTGSVWASPAYAFAGKIESLGKDYSVHLMPAGKLYGRIAMPPSLKPQNPRYEAIPEKEAARQYPLEADLYKSNANALWANGVITVVKWDDTGVINIYGDATLLTSPETIEAGEVMKSLGVRLVHDHVLHYCNKYLYELVGAPVDENLRTDTENDLKAFLRKNTGASLDRPLTGSDVRVVMDGDELLAKIEIEVKESLRRVTVQLRVRRPYKDPTTGRDIPGHVEDASRL